MISAAAIIVMRSGIIPYAGGRAAFLRVVHTGWVACECRPPGC